MDICFAGPSTREKILLMCYLGFILSAEKKVAVKTDARYFFTSADTVFLNDNLSISTKEVNADVIIRESDEIGDMNFFVYDLLGNFPRNRKDFVDIVGNTACRYIFLNNIKYSKINKNYLLKKFGIDDKNVYFLPLDEGDISLNIENCFEETLSLKGMSRNYKNLLVDIAGSVLENDVKQGKRMFKLALRSC